ncbi:MAG: GNAT family N-acetyltransferase [Candidatus Lokiarchaeota archaeon]|nr:GNAT family N-acetyltransferase [Candidatus Lokiarchaeota archaeon]
MIWHKSMQHLSWYLDPNPMDYDMKEEITELAESFSSNKHYFLIAKSKGESVGCITFETRDKLARLGITMPGVPLNKRGTMIGNKLLNECISILKSKSISVLNCTYKYRTKEEIQWHLDLVKSLGFVSQPEGTQLMRSVAESNNTADDSSNQFKILHREDVSPQSLAELTYQSFLGTVQDRAIHENTMPMTLDGILQSHNRIASNSIFFSPANLWYIAQVDDDLAGVLIGGDIGKRNDYRIGIIGELCVSPSFRRRGIASKLISKFLSDSQKMNFDYVFVGTPSRNIPGIRLYEKHGFTPTNYTINLSLAL